MAGLGLILIAAGAVSVWSGATGRSAFAVIGSLIGGKAISAVQPCEGAFGPFCAGAGSGTSSGSIGGLAKGLAKGPATSAANAANPFGAVVK